MRFVLTTQAKLPDLDDTIVALSSAVGPAARAIVRMSGRRAGGIVASLCADFDRLPAGRFYQGNLRLSSFHAPIPADVYHFLAPRTYTGQDVVEIHTISCQPIVDVLIAACLDAGARAAQAGEFTMRAFLAGKLDLTRAEAVLGVIEATDRHELNQALTQLAGGLARPMHELREDLLNLLADVEAGLDFTEEDIHFVETTDLLMRLGKGLAYLTLLRKQIEQRALGQRPFRVVLAGKPNAGKSSLFNALVGNDAALVSAEPGTTRDYLEKRLEIDGVPLELVDTAGACETAEEIDAAAQALGTQQARQADLILWCLACDDPLPSTPSRARASGWYVATKCDDPLARSASEGRAAPFLASASGWYIATSAMTGAGLAELRQRLAQEVRRGGHAALAPSLSRCRHHIEACLQHLRRAHAIVIREEMPELLALELRLGLEELGTMAGAIYTDDLLDRIFSRFCIGK
jgi:tRNA modification GTPase